MHLAELDSPPIHLSFPPANDNGGLTIAQASIPQLLYAMKGKLERFEPHQRPLMGDLMLSTLMMILGREAGHA